MTLLVTTPVTAVDAVPRISDREIIESLAGLKAGQKALEEKIELRFIITQEQMDQRFDTIGQHFDTTQKQIDYRSEAIDKQLDFIEHLMLVTIAGIFGLIGFIVWDRFQHCARWILASNVWSKIWNVTSNSNHPRVRSSHD